MPTTWWKFLAVGGAIALVGTGMYALREKRAVIDVEVAELKTKYEALKREKKSVEEKIEYYESAENRLKEAKSQFNFREPGEKLIILVPKQVTSTATSSSSSKP